MFGVRTNESDSMDIIDRAIDGGINFFDTANMYVRGKSEEMGREGVPAERETRTDCVSDQSPLPHGRR